MGAACAVSKRYYMLVHTYRLRKQTCACMHIHTGFCRMLLESMPRAHCRSTVQLGDDRGSNEQMDLNRTGMSSEQFQLGVMRNSSAAQVCLRQQCSQDLCGTAVQVACTQGSSVARIDLGQQCSWGLPELCKRPVKRLASISIALHIHDHKLQLCRRPCRLTGPC